MRHKPRVCMISLGCAKNLADSEAILGQIVAANPEAVVCSDPQDADVVVVNTCGFLEAARVEAEETLDQLETIQRRGKGLRIVVVGCYPELWKSELERRHRGLSAVMGVDALYQADFWASLLHEGGSQPPHTSVSATAMRQFAAPRLVSTSGGYAYLKIADGCSQRCTYCTIPRIKGRLVSRSPDVVLQEAAQLVEAGARELILVSQNTSAYGMDFSPDHRPQLVQLLRNMDRLPGVRLIRVLYLYPTLVDRELLETVASSQHIAHYVDIPLQHTDPSVLKAMGRPWAPGSAGRVVARVRHIIPDAAIRSTFIVGFPGETEAQFRQLLADVEALQLDHAAAFAYSREDLAPSSRYPDQVHPSTKARRLHEFMAMQQRVSLAVNERRYLHKDIDVLVDEVAGSNVTGRTLLDAPDVDNVVHVRAHGDRPLPEPGQIVKVQIAETGPYDLKGTLT
ncbi:MAG: 30S ribosomal protein S12 methylthiotransferase RimO [Candidatus Cryosericum sp.]|nr:30S ribosomal protein S12 methylthiotransferase RimO [Candidatus Cryosericum sp.]